MAPSAAMGRIATRRRTVPGPRGGYVYIPEFQRTRLLDATFALVGAEGYRRLTARRVSDWAGVSNKTFYDLFSDREDCFLAAFDYAVEQLAAVVVSAWESEKDWAAGIRAGLGALLGFLDEEPALRRLVFVEALGAGPRVLARRAEVLDTLAGPVDEGRKGVKVGSELPPLTAEGIVGATFGVIYARLSQEDSEPLTDLLNALMATIVLPYQGHAAAAREHARLDPGLTRDSNGAKGGRLHAAAGESATPLDFRLTVRTHLVLTAVARLSERGSDPSNREISSAAGVKDQGQISRLLARLEGLGLLENAGGATAGVRNAWRLTPRGGEVVSLSSNRGVSPSLSMEEGV
jgi:AcrR family transcriptional regulator/DNA-binding MarR family transcriptional regulator